MSGLSEKSFEERSNGFLAALLTTVILVLIASSLLPINFTPISINVGSSETLDRGDNEPEQLPGVEFALDANAPIEEVAEIGDQNSVSDIDLAASPGETPAEQDLASSDLAPSSPSNDSLAGLSFNLADIAGAESRATPGEDGQIEVRKSLISNGQDLGTLTVTIDKYAQLHATPGELRGILTEPDNLAGLNRVGNAQLVSFARLRDTGIDLRYDPVSDVIVLGS